MRSFKLGLALLVVLLVAAGLASAQTATTGEIAGVVSDPTGAVVAGAKITLSSDTGLRRQTVSDGTGRYQFTLLPPGQYTVLVDFKGFALEKIAGINVTITQITQVNASLRIGHAANESVQVTAEPPLVQADNAGTGRVIEQETIRQLPLPTRNFTQLLTLSTGATGSLQNSSDLGRGDAVISVNGNRTTSNAVIINGVDASSVGTGNTQNLAVPATDTLQEFIVQTSLYDASQGRNSGGVVAAITKGGTDKYHGNVYEFLRNNALNANDFFLNRNGQDRPAYRRNQFGGTFGGPIVKDRIWFFFSYQGTRENNGTSISNSLSTIFVPGNLTNNRSTAGLNTFLGAYGLSTLTVNPQALAILKAQLPNGQYLIPGAQTYTGTTTPVTDTISTPSTYREDQANINFDFKVSNSDHLTLKAFVANNPTVQGLYNFAGVGNALQAPGSPTGFNMRQRVFSAADTHVFSSHVVNELRGGYSRIAGRFQPAEPFTAADFGMSTPLSSIFPGAPTISITNMMDLGPSPLADNMSEVGDWSVGDMVTWAHGRHTMRFGGEYKRDFINLMFNAYTRGQEYFGNFATFLMGVPLITLQGSGVPDRNIRANDFNFYFQDDWRLSDRLTVNLGVRYEMYGQFTETHGRFVEFDPTLATTTMVGSQKVLTGGFVQAGSGTLTGIPKVDNGLAPNDYNNFGPRVGFSYRPFRDNDRIVFRGGYGIYFDRPNARLLNSQVFDSPYYTVAMNLGLTTAAYPNPADPFIHVPLPSTFPYNYGVSGVLPYGGAPWVFPADFAVGYPIAFSVTLPTAVPFNGIYPNRHNFVTPYVQQWNFGLQWEAVKNLMFDIGYVGSAGRKLTRVVALNQGGCSNALYGMYYASVYPQCATPYYGAMSSLAAPILSTFDVQTDGKSIYHSLQASATKRFSHGLQFLVSYTWSHSIDDYSGGDVNDLVGLPGDASGVHYFASSDFDRRQRFVASFVYDLPKAYKGGNGFAKGFLNSWEISGIATMQSGVPFSIIGSTGAFGYPFGTLASGRTVASSVLTGSVEDRLSGYFDKTAFTATPFTSFGTAGRNILIGPGQRNLDFSVVKFIPVTESQKIEFRTEFFNIFNHPNFMNPVNIQSSTNFGQIVKTATGPRVIQFAFKYSF